MEGWRAVHHADAVRASANTTSLEMTGTYSNDQSRRVRSRCCDRATGRSTPAAQRQQLAWRLAGAAIARVRHRRGLLHLHNNSWTRAGCGWPHHAVSGWHETYTPPPV